MSQAIVNNNSAVLVLAAGAGSRFGSIKQLADWHGRPMLSAVLEQQLALGLPLYVALGAHAHDILDNVHIKHCIQKGAVHIDVADWQEGLSASIRAGVHRILHSQADLDGLIIVLGDQPLIRSDDIKRLLSVAEDAADEHVIVCSCYVNEENQVANDSNECRVDQRGGVPAYFSRHYFEDLLRLSGDQGARDLIKQHSHQSVVLQSPLVDVDTKNDLLNSLELHKQP